MGDFASDRVARFPGLAALASPQRHLAKVCLSQGQIMAKISTQPITNATKGTQSNFNLNFSVKATASPTDLSSTRCFDDMMLRCLANGFVACFFKPLCGPSLSAWIFTDFQGFGSIDGNISACFYMFSELIAFIAQYVKLHVVGYYY